MKTLLVLLAVFLIGNTISAYDWYTTPYRMIRTGYADEFSRDTLFINPAVIPFLEKRAVFSINHTEHVFSLTTGNDNANYEVIHYFQPFDGAHGISFSIHNYNSNGGFRETHFDMSYGFGISSVFSIGAKASIFTQSFEYNDWTMNNSTLNESSSFTPRFDIGAIARIKPFGYLSAAIHDINSPDIDNPFTEFTDPIFPSADIGFSSFTEYGNFYTNCYLYTNELEQKKTELAFGYAYPLFNRHITPSAGITLGKTINAGLSVQYKYFSFQFGYGYNYEESLFKTLTFSIGLKFKHDWYAEYNDVHVFDSSTNFFHFIILTNHELKKSETWIQVEQKEANEQSDFSSFYIKTSIPNDEIKYAYVYVKIPKTWIAARNLPTDGITLSVIADGKREQIPLFFLYEEDDFNFYMGITKKL